ncbi:hypothetical protein Q9L58_009479 [Maublancomyces gigas]|uniref:Uncharacterized protein n=1 Tax=Discina gigas TaxID=1032678 RepID=A0ABR3G6U2_9PEZI
MSRSCRHATVFSSTLLLSATAIYTAEGFQIIQVAIITIIIIAIIAIISSSSRIWEVSIPQIPRSSACRPRPSDVLWPSKPWRYDVPVCNNNVISPPSPALHHTLPMSLLGLPNELLLNIAGSLRRPREIYALILTSRRFENLLIPILHKAAVEDKDDLTALQWACSKRHEGLAVFMLEKGVDINFYAATGAKYRRTALFHAIESRKKSLVQLLLDNGADFTMRDESGFTALHVAAQYDSDDIARLLLDIGVDAEAVNLWNSTALHTAAKYGGIAAARSLLAHGVDVGAPDQNGETPLHVCAAHDSVAVAEVLIQHGADVAACDRHGRTALHVCAAHDSVAVAEVLIQYGADLAACDRHGRTALHSAGCQKNLSAIMQLLIANGANPAAMDDQGYTALDWVMFGNNEVEEANEATIRLLLLAGIDTYTPRTLSGELLCWAVRKGHEDLVKMILEHDINVSAQDAVGRTPLHWAARFGRVDIVKMLLENGADISARDRVSNKTALALAVTYVNDEVASLLLEKNAEKPCTGARERPALHGSVRGVVVDLED